MNSRMKILFFCLVVAAAPLAARAGGPNPEYANAVPGPELIARLCDGSEDKDFCVSSISARPEANTATPVQLGVIALSVVSSNASDTKAYIKSTLSKHGLTPALEDAFEDCSNNYLDAVGQLDDSLAALLSNAYTDADTWLDAAISDGESCAASLDSADGDDAELERRNHMFLKLCKNALMINRKLTP